MNYAIESRGLSFRYPDVEGGDVLDGFNACFEANECLGLAGPNGSGKTTFMMILAGFYEASRGDIILSGEKIDFHDAHCKKRQRRLIGFSFYNPDDQLFMPTVLEDVCFGPLNTGMSQEDAEAKSMDILDSLGIANLASRFPRHLSAGQKRLAALAGLLVMDPEIIVLDEPTAFLDPYSRRQIIRLIKNLTHTRLVISHDLELMLDICSKATIISTGRNIAEGKPEILFKDESLMQRCRLEVPFRLK